MAFLEYEFFPRNVISEAVLAYSYVVSLEVMELLCLLSSQ